MVRSEPPHIDSALDPIRAAIRVVAEGSAERITVYTPNAAQLLPAARTLARGAGLSIEAADGTDPQRDFMAVAARPRTA